MGHVKSVLRRRSGRLFRWASVFIALIVFAGFARTFYLRPLFKPTTLSLFLQIHATLMTAWIVLFLVQAQLIGRGKSEWHRALGVFGFGLFVVMMCVALSVVVGAVLQAGGPAFSMLFVNRFVGLSGLDLLAFGGLVAAAFALRGRPDIHKRLMLMGTICLLPPAFGRIVGPFIPHHTGALTLVFMTACVAAIWALDTRCNHRLHPVLLWTGGIVIAVNFAERIPWIIKFAQRI